MRRARNALIAVAEDIEWLQQQWAADPDKLSDADVRRGGATLRRLLLERGQGTIMAAWRQLGFDGQPCVTGPDLIGLLDQTDRPIEHAVSVVAGGVPVSNVVVVGMGVHRVAHPKTGVPADAEEGFAVMVGSIVRRLPQPGEEVPESPYDGNVLRRWRLMDYLDAPGGIRRGQSIRRRDIIQFYCKDAGGVHLDDLFGADRARTSGEQLAAELDQYVFTDWRNGLTLEVLAIGHALGSSEDLAKLAAAIRSLPDDDPSAQTPDATR
jgi:hypothetical protein